MNTEQIKALLKQGLTTRQIATQLDCSRDEVKSVAVQMAWTNRSRVLLASSLLLLLAAILVVALHEALHQPTNLEVAQQIIKDADSLPVNKSGSSWFMERESKLDNHQEVVGEINLVLGLMGRVSQALSDNNSVPGVREEQQEFGGHIMPSIFSMFAGGTSRVVSFSANPPAQDAKMIEVVFYPHDALNHPHVGHKLLFYDAGWHSLFIAALKFTDDKWYDAYLTHELWHALQHRRGNPSATAPQLSDLWVEEELQAHDLEKEVLNVKTHGEYARRIEAIVSHKWFAWTLPRFISKIKPEDFQQLDQIFAPGIGEEVDLRAAQYEFNLSEAWLSKRYNGKELKQKKIDLYRFIFDPTQSTNVQ